MEEREVYLNPDFPVEERVEDLISRMSLKEKIGQLKARGLHLWKIFSELFEGLPDDKREKVAS